MAGEPTLRRLPAGEGPDRSELRAFGATLAAGFGALAALLLWRGHEGAAAVPALLAALLLASLSEPARLSVLRRRWMAAARALSRVTNRLLLGIVYFLVATPMGAAARLLGWDPLGRNPRARDTYWKGRERREDEERYHRPY